MDREYVSYGLRRRAAELATERLGPRPERARVDQLKQEAELKRYTGTLRSSTWSSGAEGSTFGRRLARPPTPILEADLRTRLEALSRLGLASQARNEWRLIPQPGPELERMGRRAEGIRAIRGVLAVSTNRCRVIAIGPSPTMLSGRNWKPASRECCVGKASTSRGSSVRSSRQRGARPTTYPSRGVWRSRGGWGRRSSSSGPSSTKEIQIDPGRVGLAEFTYRPKDATLVPSPELPSRSHAGSRRRDTRTA
jgi:hypothetical protein